MKSIAVISAALILTACATTNSDTFDTRYSQSDIAQLTAEHFDVLASDAEKALKPAFKKYGQPHAYIDGLMSSISDPDKDQLFGSGNFSAKLRPTNHTFWRIDGDNLAGHLDPVKTAHLVYDIVRLDPLSDSFVFTETLTQRGQKFSIFERQIDNKIVITIHPKDELLGTSLQEIAFYRD